MNIALTSIFIFLLLLPGILFRRMYYTSHFSHQFSTSNFFELFFASFVPAIVIHAAIAGTFSFWYPIQFDLLFALLMDSNDAQVKLALEHFQSNQTQVFAYLLSSFGVGLLSGWVGQLLVIRFQLDRRFSIFRFKNKWHYYFTGAFLEFQQTAQQVDNPGNQKIDLTYLQILVDSREGTLLYDGLLVNYDVDASGELTALSMSQVRRRKLNDDVPTDSDGDSAQDSRYYHIMGNVMRFEADKIINMNLTYYFLEFEQDEQSGDFQVALKPWPPAFFD
ncbi:hypothetical protein [Pontibacter sp. G13]|uniref:hypothetical protein n=1 Tax=Pontibacter sp. G13 TaxID=3074898 RepID=UPI00288BA5C2|nr:hypothetical protein [Pontibacter sp. G13]WNJ20486.1 hypothetical protein RJD25_08390 [Pontibacter sp. G13]